MQVRLPSLAALALAAALAPAATHAAEPPSYLVAVSEATHADNDWAKVAETLAVKHHAKIATFDKSPAELLPALQQTFPAYLAVVATPEEANRNFVATVHQTARKLDDDPYTDTRWGIVTGYNAANALDIAAHAEPLTIDDALSGTELAMDRIQSGQWFCELVKNKAVRKKPGGEAETLTLEGDGDTTALIAGALNGGPDLFVTSGHATERDWQIGFRYKNGYFKCADGQVYGLDTKGEKHPVSSPNPKVYMPIGNCLMGNILDRESMALAFLNSAGVKQMLGYTVPTWYGYGGWGVLDYFVEQPGRYTFTDAFWANQHALVHRLATAELSAGDKRGLAFDRDVVTFYGDPAWRAKMADGPLNFSQDLAVENGTHTLTITPNRGDTSYAPVNTNGSQRGGRPFVAFLPGRIDPASVKITAGADLNPVVTDDFILVPHPGTAAPATPLTLTFTASTF